MARQPLFTALLTADLAEHILPHLPLPSLGCLACTSRAARTWVDSVPEDVWQVLPGLQTACFQLIQDTHSASPHAGSG